MQRRLFVFEWHTLTGKRRHIYILYISIRKSVNWIDGHLNGRIAFRIPFFRTPLNSTEFMFIPQMLLIYTQGVTVAISAGASQFEAMCGGGGMGGGEGGGRHLGKIPT